MGSLHGRDLGGIIMLDAMIFILAGVIVGYVIRLAQEMKEDANEID
jgi:hypothetical protein